MKFPYTPDHSKIPEGITKLLCIRHNRCLYRCPNGCWSEHLEGWRKARREGNEKAAEPIQPEHCMFEKPLAYGMVMWGCTDDNILRLAHENIVRGDLSGWDRDILPEQLDIIVKATVDARMAGKEVGAAPWLACIMGSIQ